MTLSLGLSQKIVSSTFTFTFTLSRSVDLVWIISLKSYSSCISSTLNLKLLCSWLQAIRRMIDKKTVDVYAMFNEELNAVKRELTQKLAPLPASHPKFSGQCMWAKMLKRGIERSMMVCLLTCYAYRHHAKLFAHQVLTSRSYTREITARYFYLRFSFVTTFKKLHSLN